MKSIGINNTSINNKIIIEENIVTKEKEVQLPFMILQHCIYSFKKKILFQQYFMWGHTYSYSEEQDGVPRDSQCRLHFLLTQNSVPTMLHSKYFYTYHLLMMFKMVYSLAFGNFLTPMTNRTRIEVIHL